MASRFRASKTTLREWEQELAALNEAREENANLSFLVAPESSNGRWLSRPLVDLIADAHSGFSGKYANTLAGISSLREGNKRLSYQAAAYKLLLPLKHPANFSAELCRRLCLWLEPAKSSANLLECMTKLLQTLHTYRPAFKIAVLKTISNSWATSCKRQERDPGCLFHCTDPAGSDKLSHYLQCPKLWSQVCAQSKARNLETWQEKLCLDPLSCEVSINVLHTVVEAYQCQYHHRSRDIQSIFHDAIRRTQLLDSRPNETDRQTRSYQSPPLRMQRGSSTAPARNGPDYSNLARASGMRMPVSFGGLA